MRHLQNTLLVLMMGTVLQAVEPSVYGNGNSEAFYAPQKEIANNKKTIDTLNRKLTQQNERIEGLRSIVEGLSATLNELVSVQASKALAGAGDNTVLLKELGTMIDKINTEYVSKDEFQKALRQKGKSVKKVAKNKTSKQLYSEGVRLFLKKRYDEAKKRFTMTDIKGHKPAASNYYLGEIAYYTKQYTDAIFHFKKSAGLYDQASYIDTLLLHTAVSLEKSGEKAQAKDFYKNIIANYAGKKSARIAKQKLKKL